MTRSASTTFSVYRRPLFILIILLAFGLRVYQSGAYGLYLDEKYTLIISQGIAMEGANQKDVFFTPGKVYFTPEEFWKPKTLADFVEANVRGDIGNSPVYYALLWLWMQVFGLSDFAIRLLSVVFSTAVVGLVYTFVRRHLKSENLALGCALLAAIEPFFVAYSHMARNYSFSFFLTLLATHLFLLLCEPYSPDNQHIARQNANRTGLFAAYGLLITLSVLSHYLTVTVFLCHGLYLLFFARAGQLWGRLAVVYGLAFVPVVLWFVYGGGRYTFQTLAYQAQLYREAALHPEANSQYGLVLPATLGNVVKRALPIGADLFMMTNGLGVESMGYRNLLLAVGLGVVIAGLIRRYGRSPSTTVPIGAAIAVPVLLAAGYGLYTTPSLQLIVAAMVPTFVYLLYRGLKVNRFDAPGSLLFFLGMLALIPTLFLIVMSVKNGHTYGITQRYSGFSFPYAIIFVALMGREALALPVAFRASVLAVLVLQLGFIGLLLLRIYQDRDPKYTYFARPRVENPYFTSAQRIKQQYAQGDTVLYPSHLMVAHDAVERTHSPFSIEDAQLTNLYLPKDARYPQRLDTTQTDRIILVKGNGQRITIVDFKGRTFRY
ncbi:MAG: glycosyltransferase family 39 protein [Bacteroidetes bacterium]|nr:glycosyltransferase family 39 protein [Fibrella sp.]